LVVVRPIGDGLGVTGATPTAVDEAAVANLWDELNRVHAPGINHRRIDLDRVVVTPESDETTFWLWLAATPTRHRSRSGAR
jgi:hypothetical protein